MPLALDLRPLPEILRRSITRELRLLKILDPMPTIFQWRVKGWENQGEPPLLSEAGPVHLTICAHESFRPLALLHGGWKGVLFLRNSETWRVTLVFFCFSLTFAWCHTPNFAKVDPVTLSRRGI